MRKVRIWRILLVHRILYHHFNANLHKISRQAQGSKVSSQSFSRHLKQDCERGAIYCHRIIGRIHGYTERGNKIARRRTSRRPSMKIFGNSPSERSRISPSRLKNTARRRAFCCSPLLSPTWPRRRSSGSCSQSSVKSVRSSFPSSRSESRAGDTRRTDDPRIRRCRCSARQ